MLIGLIIYSLAIARGVHVHMILFTLPFGFWGLLRIEDRGAQSGAILLAAATAITDWFVETWAVGAGNYGYKNDFSIETPLTYAMLVLGFIGMITKSRPR